MEKEKLMSQKKFRGIAARRADARSTWTAEPDLERSDGERAPVRGVTAADVLRFPNFGGGSPCIFGWLFGEAWSSPGRLAEMPSTSAVTFELLPYTPDLSEAELFGMVNEIMSANDAGKEGLARILLAKLIHEHLRLPPCLGQDQPRPSNMLGCLAEARPRHYLDHALRSFTDAQMPDSQMHGDAKSVAGDVREALVPGPRRAARPRVGAIPRAVRQ